MGREGGVFPFNCELLIRQRKRGGKTIRNMQASNERRLIDSIECRNVRSCIVNASKRGASVAEFVHLIFSTFSTEYALV